MRTTLSAPNPPIPLSVPSLGGRAGDYLRECLETGWVSSAGPFVERFERQLADVTGAAHVIAVASGTAGLHVALLQAGVGPEDEVLVPDLTFVATANAVRYCGAHPIFVDADPRTWQLDPEKLEQFLRTRCVREARGCVNRSTGRRVRAIVPVHLLGMACAMDRIVALARDHDVTIVEDAAEAIGVRIRGRHAGTFGHLGVLSFNGNKLITCGGGGAVLANDADAARRVRYLTTQAKDDPIESVHHEVGYNYRLTNLQAALGCAQLEQLDHFLVQKRAMAAAYDAALRDLDELTRMSVPADIASTYWLYTVLLPPGTTVSQRRDVVRRLNAEGVGARPLWHPLHGLPPFRGCETVAIEHSPNLYARAVSLPSSVSLTEHQQQRVVAVLRQALAGHCTVA
jgi:perosamine synthetase